LIAGLPLAVAFSWAFELTPDGLKREQDVQRDASISAVTAKRLDSVTIVLMVMAMSMLAADWLWFKNPGPPPSSPVAAEQLVTVESSPGEPAIPIPIPIPDRSIAVLPFDNLSADEDNAFFASGVHEDILTYLSRVSDLRVISRTSVLRYADQVVDLRQVAQELGVSHILEGSVRRAGGRVRVTAQLIDASSDQHLWADNFDRDLADIFEIQSSVAQEIVAAIGIRLSADEARSLSRRPTASVEAYDLFLQARQWLNSAQLTDETDVKAQELLEQAIELDPQFALAYALLADAHGGLYWFKDRSPARLAAMKEAIDRAFELQPDLVEARVALAQYYYRGFYDYPSAIEQLEIAVESMPNDSQLHHEIGLTLRRLGRFSESIAAFERASRLDPSSENHLAEMMDTIKDAGHWDTGWRLVDRILTHYPDSGELRARVALFVLEAEADTERAREMLTHDPLNSWYDAAARVDVELWSRNFDQAIAAAEQARDIADQLSDGISDAWIAQFHGYKGDQEAARSAWQVALPKLEAVAASRPDYVWPLLYMGFGYAALDRRQDARESCDRAKTILPLEKDKIHGATVANWCAEVSARIGDRDQALEEIKMLMTVETGLKPLRLARSPEWDFFRDDPRFVALYESQ
jgi:TolB-like protein